MEARYLLAVEEAVRIKSWKTIVLAYSVCNAAGMHLSEVAFAFPPDVPGLYIKPELEAALIALMQLGTEPERVVVRVECFSTGVRLTLYSCN